jgi:hypothetical protein
MVMSPFSKEVKNQYLNNKTLFKYARPSNAATWLNCSASLQFCLDNEFESKPAKYTELGSWAHYLWQVTNQPHLKGLIEPENCEFTSSADIDDEMVGAIGAANDYAARYVDLKKCADNHEFVVPCFYDHTRRSIIDFWGISDRGILHIFDLKYGKTPVSVEKSKAMQIYAISLLDFMATSKDFTNPRFPEIRVHILQPRINNGFTACSYSIKELIQIKKEILEYRKDILSSEKLVFRPSESTCQWCPAKINGACPVLAYVNVTTMKPAFEKLPMAKQKTKLYLGKPIPDEMVEQIWHSQKDLKAWIDSVCNYFKQRVSEGQFPGYKLQDTYGHRKWNTEQLDRVEAFLSEHLTSDEYLQTKVISPNQVERLWSKNKYDKLLLDTLSKYIVRPVSGSKVIETNETVPAISDQFENYEKHNNKTEEND